jgi:hypothetical protein
VVKRSRWVDKLDTRGTGTNRANLTSTAFKTSRSTGIGISDTVVAGLHIWGLFVATSHTRREMEDTLVQVQGWICKIDIVVG